MEKAGLRAGDVLVSLNERTIDSLNAYAAILGELEPGDAVKIRFLRGSGLRTVEAQVAPR